MEPGLEELAQRDRRIGLHLQDGAPGKPPPACSTARRKRTRASRQLPRFSTWPGRVTFIDREAHPHHGALQILKVILSYDYLWQNIRVKGGAYGCMSSFNRIGEGYLDLLPGSAP